MSLPCLRDFLPSYHSAPTTRAPISTVFHKRVGERNWTSLSSPSLFDSEGLGLLEAHMRSSTYDQPLGFQKTVECVKEQQQITQ